MAPPKLPPYSRLFAIAGVAAASSLCAFLAVRFFREDIAIRSAVVLAVEVHAPGAQLTIAGRPAGTDTARVLLRQDDWPALTWPEETPPGRALLARWVPGATLVSEPDWSMFADLPADQPRLMVLSETVEYSTPGGERGSVLVLAGRTPRGRAIAIPVQASRGPHRRLRWLRTDSSTRVLRDWWHRRILKRTETIWERVITLDVIE